jgi:natural product biosynthesis luciferase-like monooxygenase protein
MDPPAVGERFRGCNDRSNRGGKRGASGAANGILAAALAQTRATLRAARSGFAADLIARDPKLRGLAPPQLAISGFDAALPGAIITLTPLALHVDISRLPRAEAEALHARIDAIVPRLRANPAADLREIDPLSAADRALLARVNATDQPHDRSITIPSAFEAQVDRSPQAPALIFEDQLLTYAQLNGRANRVAHVLRDLGVGPGILVGLCTHRSTDMIIGALAILKAGGGYVPMDPNYPAERIALFVEDSRCPVIVTSSDLEPLLPGGKARHLCLDTDGRIGLAPGDNLACGPKPEDIAYMIYTSGSTGRPKGVMVEHRNVANFFIGMDARIDHAAGSVWLAITSLSFDISVLELFWTLARGFKLVLSSDEQRRLVSSGRITSGRHMDFSLYYWGNDDGAGPKKYALLLEGARFADSHGFAAIWTPERHFHAFGGPYPNPSVTGAAVAAVTSNISVRAGACVLPLHHPARVAEEWAVIDNLTNGRAGLAVASGWHPEDFVLRPESSPPANRRVLLEATDQIRRLWRGEAVEFPMADGGSLAVKTQPRPVSRELPIWITTAGNPETWRDAGRIGAHVLTHLLGQSIEELAAKINLYHVALRAAGHDPEAFSVTLMLHSFLARDRALSRDTARGPMKAYLRSAAGLIKQYAWSFPAFKKPKGISHPAEIDIRSLSEDELEAILDFAFQRYFEDSGLFGTVEDGLARVEQLKRIGVSEVACLIDYGIAPEKVMEGFYPLAELVRRANSGGGVEEGDWSIAAQILRHGVTHLQCTPSMARMIAMNDDSRMALSRVGTLMLGGEALPAALVSDLRRAGVARILNMYGPTETTIWSTIEALGETVEGTANIGTPLANQQVHVLDEHMAPVPPGTAGELWIGGEGVTRGYWQRPDLTDERFRSDPFVLSNPEAGQTGRIYRSGDLVRMRLDGRLDFLGRADFQVKLRGFRIELGEIEAAIEAQPGVTQAVVLAREDNPGDLRLVAYVSGQYTAPALRAALAATLPEHMLPAHFIKIDSFPLTPNRKVDRKALPAPAEQSQSLSEPFSATPSETSETFVLPARGLEAQIATIWCRVLGLPKVGANDNFFALGGHSLLAVQMHREIRQELGLSKLSITDIFRFATLRALSAYLDPGSQPRLQAGPAQPVKADGQDQEQADAQSKAMARRRAMRAGRTESGSTEPGPADSGRADSGRAESGQAESV